MKLAKRCEHEQRITRGGRCPHDDPNLENCMRTLNTPSLAIGLTLLLGGCAGSILPSHFHDDDRATRTAKLAGLVDAYAEKAPSIFQTMLESSHAIAAEQDNLLADLADNRNTSNTQQLPFR